jgi:hypothetical protein
MDKKPALIMMAMAVATVTSIVIWKYSVLLQSPHIITAVCMGLSVGLIAVILPLVFLHPEAFTDAVGEQRLFEQNYYLGFIRGLLLVGIFMADFAGYIKTIIANRDFLHPDLLFRVVSFHSFTVILFCSPNLGNSYLSILNSLKRNTVLNNWVVRSVLWLLIGIGAMIILDNVGEQLNPINANLLFATSAFLFCLFSIRSGKYINTWLLASSLLLLLCCLGYFVPLESIATLQNLYLSVSLVLFCLYICILLNDKEIDYRGQIGENVRQKQELEDARNLQLSMLPQDKPSTPQIDISWYMETATEVGGDYYDYTLDSDGNLTIVLGDATGHGMQAGTVVTASKTLFQSMGNEPQIIEMYWFSVKWNIVSLK